MKQVLIFGGTQFIGRNLVEYLLNKSDLEITLFNRQKTGSPLFPNVNKIKGDRQTNDINKIANQHWDYVIDLSCYYPNSLVNILKHLNKDVKKYICVSTCSVYDNSDKNAFLNDEESTVLSCSEDERTDSSPASYGNRKVACEHALIEAGIPHLILRPALVYGRYDHTDRFYYWLYQVKKNQPILLPDNGERKFSITYVKDLVQAITSGLENDEFEGIFNVISSPQISIRAIVETSSALLKKEKVTLSANPDFLKKNEIDQWTDMPLWIDGDHFTFNNEKIINHVGFEPIEFKKSVEQTIAFFNSIGWKEPKYGMTEKRRKKLIETLND